VRVIAAGLNARTATLEDPAGPCGGEYSCNGRASLMPILHQHKPIDAVIIALGCNDQKSYYNLTASRIAEGVRCLVRDIKKSSECGPHWPKGTNKPPKILIVVPPVLKTTPKSKEWGFTQNQSHHDMFTAYNKVAFEEDISMLDLNQCQGCEVSEIDGVHYPLEAQEHIAAHLSISI
jgi:lysophospholipase L1-like esterase